MYFVRNGTGAPSVFTRLRTSSTLPAAFKWLSQRRPSPGVYHGKLRNFCYLVSSVYFDPHAPVHPSMERQVTKISAVTLVATSWTSQTSGTSWTSPTSRSSRTSGTSRTKWLLLALHEGVATSRLWRIKKKKRRLTRRILCRRSGRGSTENVHHTVSKTE